MQPKHIVLAYSGGLDTSTALHYLKQKYQCEITAYCANLGQHDDFAALRQRALHSGADHFILEDIRKHFIEDFVFAALRANAAYEGNYLLGAPLARPAIVEGMINYAHKVGADAIAHGCTPKGNDQIRFELSATLLDRNIITISPWREWPFTSREDLLAYCEHHHIPIIHNKENLFSHDENLIHLTTEGDYLEDIANPFRWEHASWITPPQQAPDKIEEIWIGFKQGIPVKLNGKDFNAVDLIEQLNNVGGRNGVGLQDIIENRVNGIKVRGIFENPALIILHIAHKKLECVAMNAILHRIRNMLTPEYAEIVYKGLWFSEERLALQALVDKSQQWVSGEVLIQLYKGNCTAAAVKSDYSLYRQNIATLHAGKTFDARDATGFINTLALSYHFESERKFNNN